MLLPAVRSNGACSVENQCSTFETAATSASSCALTALNSASLKPLPSPGQVNLPRSTDFCVQLVEAVVLVVAAAQLAAGRPPSSRSRV